MDANVYRHALIITGTVATIRNYTRNKRTPFLAGLLDDILYALFALLGRTPLEADTPQGFHPSIVRILTFLIEEASKNGRPDIADALTACQQQIKTLPREP